jgi:phage tail sheath protein FI
MPEYLAPGVYVEEVDTGSKPIEGVSTSTAGMVGVTERGPRDVPILITSMGEFRRWFGDMLDDDEFRNGNGYHCYLPHAVDGFFTNGGQRVYVTRVLRDDARKSSTMLFDRGDASAVFTSLLRTAGQGSGTLVNTPLISVLEPGALAVGDWIRIGDGSQAEYRRLTGAVHPTTHIALNYPLSFSHDAGAAIRQIPRVTSGGSFTTVDAVEAGATTLNITGNAAQLTAYDGAIGTTVLEIGAHPHAEHKIVSAIVGTGTTRTITLSSPLARAYPAGTTLQPLNLAPPSPPAVINNTTLLTGCTAGDTVVFGSSLGGEFDDINTLLIIDVGGANPEIRRISELQELPLARRTYATYPRGTRVEQMAAADDNRLINAVAANADTLVLQGAFNTTGLAAGQRIVIGTGGTAETRTIQSIDEGANSIRLTTPVAAAHPAGTSVSFPRSLTAAVAAGSVSISLDTRLGISVGDVLRIGDAPNEEYVSVAALSGDPGSAPDAGGVILSVPLARAHDAGTAVRRSNVTAAGGAHHPVFTVIDATSGSASLYVTDDDGFAANNIVRVQTPTGLTYIHRLSGAASAVTPTEFELDAPLDRSHEIGSPIAQRDPIIQVEAIDEGRWGDRLRISVEDEPNGLVSGAFLTTVNNPTDIKLSSPTGVEAGTVLELLGPDDGDGVIGPLLKVESINRTNNRITLATPLNGEQMNAFVAATSGGKKLRVRSREFRLSVLLMRRPDPAVPSRDDSIIDRELFPNLSMDPRHSRYFVTVIGDINGPKRPSDRRPEGSSWYIRVSDIETVQANQEAVRLGPETLVDILPSGRSRAARHALAQGDDAIALLDDSTYIGTDAVDPEDRTGLQALKNIEDISIVAVPGRTSVEMQGALISHCENMRYRFAILDAVRPPNDSISDVRAQRQNFDTKYAALYHPWLLGQDPYPGVSTTPGSYIIPPSGHIAGIYARTDIERGVHKAPANEVVRGVLGLQRSLSKGEHDLLNPYPVNINVIRDFRSNNRGIRVWGGRVITSDSDWKYVNVRRLMIFLEHSIERGLQWVVFEPNAEPLWARVRRTVANFLTTVWRNGALEGTKAEEAFFVKCDRTTMTQADIDNGRLICVIGVAPVKPAEYVIIQIGLWTAHAED